MNALRFVCVLATTVFISSSASAEWTGTQLLTIAGVDSAPLTDTVSVRGSAHLFMIPEHDVTLLFSYVGPKFQLADWFWTSPQIGTVAHWTPSGGDAFLASVWNGVSLAQSRIFIFAEADVYVYDGKLDYYGYYFLDYNIGQFAIGPQFEHVNKNEIVGPHLTLYSRGGQFFSTQYFVAAKDEFEHTCRFVVGLFF